jgi:hypothetical protein
MIEDINIVFSPKYFAKTQVTWKTMTSLGIFSISDEEVGLGSPGVFAREYKILIPGTAFPGIGEGEIIRISSSPEGEDGRYMVRKVRKHGVIQSLLLTKEGG